MNVIVAVDNNWAIGSGNRLLVSIPNDQRQFREETTGKVVVLGRKTLATFPQGMPLKNRVNIILSRDKDYHVKDAVVVHSVEALMEELKQYADQDVYVIGGESIYRQLLDNCDTAYITRWDFAYDADAHLPNLDERDDWRLAEKGEEQTCFDLIYSFDRYERV